MTTPCSNLSKLLKNGETYQEQWDKVRNCLHPAQSAVGYSAVKRKHDKDYKTASKAQARMSKSEGFLPFVLGPNEVPYLVDSHHTVSALEASGHHQVTVTLQKICDWSDMTKEAFVARMKKENFMDGTGRTSTAAGSVNVPPVAVEDVTTIIPSRIADLKDDPWRSLAALVRKVKDKENICPADNRDCLRGYKRECQADGRMTPFFEFRWAYFFNDAYTKGCSSQACSYWDDLSDCQRFQDAYEALLKKDVGAPILKQDKKAWQEAANLLVPLCRGKVAQEYILPETLGSPMGGGRLPGRVAGKTTQILENDPSCNAPSCPTASLTFLSGFPSKLSSTLEGKSTC